MAHKSLYTLSILCLFGMSNIYAQTTPSVEPDSLSKWNLFVNTAPLFSKLRNSDFKNDMKRQLGWKAGVDVAYTFKQTSKYQLAVSLGLGYDLYRNKMSLQYNDSLWTTDKDEKVYLKEKAENLVEKQSLHYLAIPLQLRASYLIQPKLSAYLNLGIAYGISLNAKYKDEAILTRTGYYPSTHATLYDIDIAQSPYFYPVSKSVSNTDKISVRNNLTWLTSIGARYKVNENYEVFGGLTSILGLVNINKSNNTEPIVLSDNNGNLQSQLNRGGKYYTTAWGIEVGVSCKLKCKHQPAPPVVTKVEEPVKPVPTPVVVAKVDTVKPIEKPKPIDTVKIVEAPKVVEVPKPVDTIKKETPKPTQAVEIKSNETINMAKIEKGSSFKFGNVQFQSGTDILTPASFEALNMLVKILAENPNLVLEVSGHTDNSGKDEGNNIISKKRANAVKNYLVGKGIKATQLIAKGYGSSQPIADNATPEGRAKNRRVEFKVLEK